jgi:hypothetical protein
MHGAVVVVVVVMMMMIPAGDNSWIVHQISLAVLPAETSGECRRNGRRSENFAHQYLKCLKGSLTCRKILRHGTSGFTSHPKEGVLRILSPLKIHRLGLLWTRDPWVQCKHTNHYTTEATHAHRTDTPLKQISQTFIRNIPLLCNNYCSMNVFKNK